MSTGGSRQLPLGLTYTTGREVLESQRLGGSQSSRGSDDSEGFHVDDGVVCVVEEVG
jgi:hypothetical protein